MTTDRLAAALADRYRIEPERGQGGRATVSRKMRYLMLSTRLPLVLLLATLAHDASAQPASTRAAIGDTVTTSSGLRYVFLQHGSGPKPDSADMVVIHGIGRLADGTVIWNTRETGPPFEYTYLVDGVIAGFREGMALLREGDRIIMIMKPELAYGARERPPIPPHSTLTFDYEILGVYADALPRLLREGFATDGVDATLERLAARPDLWRHYASEASLLAEAGRAGRTNRADRAKVMAFALTLAPLAYRLHQAYAGELVTAGRSAEATDHFQAAVRLNPRVSERELADFQAARRAVAQEPLPGGEAALRLMLEGLQAGTPDYSRMSAGLANLVREQVAPTQAMFARLGAMEALTFKGVGAEGEDIYVARFATFAQEWRFRLDAEGIFIALSYEDPPAP